MEQLSMETLELLAEGVPLSTVFPWVNSDDAIANLALKLCQAIYHIENEGGKPSWDGGDLEL